MPPLKAVQDIRVARSILKDRLDVPTQQCGVDQENKPSLCEVKCEIASPAYLPRKVIENGGDSDWIACQMGARGPTPRAPRETRRPPFHGLAIWQHRP